MTIYAAGSVRERTLALKSELERASSPFRLQKLLRENCGSVVKIGTHILSVFPCPPKFNPKAVASYHSSLKQVFLSRQDFERAFFLGNKDTFREYRQNLSIFFNNALCAADLRGKVVESFEGGLCTGEQALELQSLILSPQTMVVFTFGLWRSACRQRTQGEVGLLLAKNMREGVLVASNPLVSKDPEDFKFRTLPGQQ